MNPTRNTVLATFLFFLISGCGREKSVVWTESAYIPSVGNLAIKRSVVGNVNSELGGVGTWDVSQTKLSFETKGKNDLPRDWIGTDIPLLIDFKEPEKTWAILTTEDTCESWNAMGRPNPPYSQYEYGEGGVWRKTDLDARFLGRPTNLLADPSPKDNGRSIGLDEKELRRRGAAQKYKNILKVWGIEQDNFCL